MCSYALGYQAVRHDARALERHTRRWAAGLARGWGLRIEAHDVDRVPIDRACVLMANHQSYADVVSLFLALPVLPVFLAKRELRAVPLFGRVMETGGHVFIDRAAHQSAVETIEAAAQRLRPGSPLLVFPEGTRATRPVISRFKKGGFHLARRAGVPIVPIGIRGSLDVWPRDAAAPRPGTVELHVGEPIDEREVAEGTIDELIERVRARVGTLAALPLAPT